MLLQSLTKDGRDIDHVDGDDSNDDDHAGNNTELKIYDSKNEIYVDDDDEEKEDSTTTITATTTATTTSTTKPWLGFAGPL